jgi:hypothetical protein
MFKHIYFLTSCAALLIADAVWAADNKQTIAQAMMAAHANSFGTGNIFQKAKIDVSSWTTFIDTRLTPYINTNSAILGRQDKIIMSSYKDLLDANKELLKILAQARQEVAKNQTVQSKTVFKIGSAQSIIQIFTTSAMNSRLKKLGKEITTLKSKKDAIEILMVFADLINRTINRINKDFKNIKTQ